jgi:hypothetical protein
MSQFGAKRPSSRLSISGTRRRRAEPVSFIEDRLGGQMRSSTVGPARGRGLGGYHGDGGYHIGGGYHGIGRYGHRYGHGGGYHGDGGA